jgi:transcriptional regulator with XRE-family HTH domain
MQGSLAKKLRVLRAEKQLTMRAAADLVGIRPQTLSDIEHGYRTPHDITLAKIAEAYEVPLDELIEEPTGKGPAPRGSGQPPSLDEARRLAGAYDMRDVEELTSSQLATLRRAGISLNASELWLLAQRLHVAKHPPNPDQLVVEMRVKRPGEEIDEEKLTRALEVLTAVLARRDSLAG